ncbi:MAG TPA: phosphatase PAP2 family protein [Alphaproteobacteria bacterium]|nr:phosphatase PAP2 family protein [Alphaproteobacteria bacterium]
MVKKKTKKGSKKIFDSNILKILLILIIIIAASFIFDKLVLKFVDKINPFENPNVSSPLFSILYFFTLIGDWNIFIWIIIFLAISLYINKKPVMPYFLTLITASIANTLIKLIINKPRPFENLGFESIIATIGSSFPSGHAMLIFSIVPIVSRHFPRIKILFWIIASLVSLSRIYLGVHYLSDVVAGAILGYAIGWLYLKLGETYGWKY